MSQWAEGRFEVQLRPLPDVDERDGLSLGRMALDKRFEGDLAGTGQGLMLTAMTPVKGSAGYVAIERFVGTLAGRSGGFAFLHRGVMAHGAQDLSITVVPDSGSGGLQGLSGSLQIRVEGGQHFYSFRYQLP